jgi:hypothetical protein
MPNIQIPQAVAAFAADGGADGFITVADNTPFYPGATVFLVDNNGLSQECVITKLSGATKIGVRFTNGPKADGSPARGYNYGRNPCDAFTLANGSRIMQDSQLCPVEHTTVVKKILIS